MRVIKERTVEDYFIQRFTLSCAIGEQRKYKSRMHDPDRIILLPKGRVIFLELKRPGATPRPGQIREHNRLRSLGFEVQVVDSKESVDSFIATIANEGVQ